MSTDKIDVSKVSVPRQSRSTARPKGEKQSDTSAPSGPEEDNARALIESRDDAGPISSGAGTLETSIDITRATMAVPIEPWRLADDRELHAKGQCGRREECKACELQYALAVVQSRCAGVANLIYRTLERADGALYDESLITGEKPKAEDWPSRQLNTYNLARSAFPEVLSGIVSMIDNDARRKWTKVRFDVFSRSDHDRPFVTAKTAPIPVRKADFNFVETDTRDVFELHFSLRSSEKRRTKKEFVLPLRAKDQRMYRDLRVLAEGTARAGALTIKRSRKHKWELRISYKRQVQRVPGDKIAAVNRGITCILAAVTEDDEHLIYDGHDIEAHLNATQNQRRRYQRTYKVSNRKGKGRKKALRPTEPIKEKSARWRKTRTQTVARETARWLYDRGVARVLLDDLKGIRDGSIEMLDGGKPVWDRIQSWPYYDMGQRLKACCEELGIKVEDRAVYFASRTCPKCGRVHEERTVGRIFNCEECNYYRHVDVVLGKNLINRERGLAPQNPGEKKRKKKRPTPPRKRGSCKSNGKHPE